MDKKPSIDFGVIAPILLGVFSLLGICVVFGTWLYKDERAPVQPPATETPFQYIYMGTEPGLSTLTPEPTETPIVIESPAITAGPEFTPTAAPPPLITLPATNSVFPTQTPVKAAATITPTIAAVLSKVDDTNSQILYVSNWTSQSNVLGAYQNTLHISFSVGNTAQFTFVGQQVIVSFQGGPSLGRINIDLDGLDFQVDQASSETQLVDWRSAVLVRGTHTLLIEHISGGSVNLDSITIPDLSTPTPTPTP